MNPENKRFLDINLQNRDTLSFIRIREDFMQVMDLMSPEFRISRKRVAEVIFADPQTFFHLHYQDNLRRGMPEEDARRDSEYTSAVQSATYFEFEGWIAVAQKHSLLEGSVLDRKIDKDQHYFYLLAHEMGHEQVPRSRSISLKEASELKFVDEETMKNLILRQLQRNPDFLYAFLEKNGRSSTKLLEEVSQSLKRIGSQETTYNAVRRILLENKNSFLEKLGLSSDDFAAFAEEEYENVVLGSAGRVISIQWGEKKILIDRVALVSESLLSELQADVYMHYCLFLRYIHKNYGEKAPELLTTQMNQLLKEYQKSDDFRDLITTDELSATYILESIMSVGSFEKILHILLDAQSKKSSEESDVRLISPVEKTAIESIIKAGQSQEVLNSFFMEITNNEELTFSLLEGILERWKKEKGNNSPLVQKLSYFLKIRDINSAFQLTIEQYNEFSFLELLLQVAKPILVKKQRAEEKEKKRSEEKEVLHEENGITSYEMGGLQRAVEGSREAREQMVVQSSQKYEMPEILQFMDEILLKSSKGTVDQIFEKAIQVIGHNRKMKYK